MTARDEASKRFDDALKRLQESAILLAHAGFPPVAIWSLVASRILAASPPLAYVVGRSLKGTVRPDEWLKTTAASYKEPESKHKKN